MPIPLAQLLISGLGALGGLFGNRRQQLLRQQTSNVTSNFLNQNRTTNQGSINPLLDPRASSQLDDILTKYKTLLNDTDLTGYRASGIQDINSLSDIQNKALTANLASRGITGPAAELAKTGSENARYSDIAKFNQGIPLLQNKLTSDALNLGTNIFSTIPRGQYNEEFGTSDQSGTQNQVSSGTENQIIPGNMLGGLFGNLAPILAYLFGHGAFGTSRTISGGGNV